MGGGKGGSDFNPKGKSDAEIMRFCQALMIELYRHLGPNTDIPAGDIGVGAREVGYMAGMMKSSVMTRHVCLQVKEFHLAVMRPEATGYGTVYFAEEMLKTRGQSFAGKTVSISGSGNVAQYAAEKAMFLGAKVVTLSDSNGTVYLKMVLQMSCLLKLWNSKISSVAVFQNLLLSMALNILKEDTLAYFCRYCLTMCNTK